MSQPPETISLAHRLATKHFRIVDGELWIGGIPIRQLAEQFGTPVFFYDQAQTN
jgi:diaminopimelate decarboxylase